MIKTRKNLGDGSRVGAHADSTLDLGEVTAGDDGRGLVVDTNLEAGGAPVDELDGTLGLDGGDGGVDVLGDDITTVHHAASHVLAVTGVALGDEVSGLEDGVGDLGNGELLVVGLLGRDDGSIGSENEVDTGVGDKVGLELSEINVEGAIETEGSGQGRDNLSDKTVKVGVGGALDVEVTTADVVDSLVINKELNIGVLEESVGAEDGVVGLNDGGGDLRRREDGETELGLLAVVDGETLEEEGTETGTGTTTSGVEDEETLETSAVIGELADTVEGKVNNLLTDGVVTTGVVVGSILLTGDQLLGVEELTVGTGADLIDDSGLKIEVDGTGDVLASTSLGEEGVESIITTTDGVISGHLAIRLDTVLEAIKLPASVTDLDTGLCSWKDRKNR
jgi:hypothetical protein